jgi:hypothetical protein
LPGRIGDVVEYRFVAEDVSATPHRTSAPVSGAYELTLLRTLDEGAEFDDPMWRHESLNYEGPDQWHREIVNPHAGLYQWKVGPTNNTAPGVMASNQDAVLTSPVIRIFRGGSLSFWHRFAFLTDELEPNYYADHGGIVQWQDYDRDGPLDRWGVLDPDAGYTHYMDLASSSPLRGHPVFSGVEPFWLYETFSFPPWVENRTIRLRLRAVTTEFDDRRPALDGWQVDDITIDPGPPPTAVALTDLAAARSTSGVHLTWRAQEVEDGDIFRIERREDGAGYTRVAETPAAAAESDYEYIDAGAPVAGDLAYRVALVQDGITVAVLETQVGGVPYRFALAPNVPNPFNPTTTIRFTLARSGWTRLAIYDTRGRHVRDLAAGVLAAGPHAFIWDGNDAAGRPVASGVYFDRLTSDGRTATRRMLLVR